MMKAFGVILGGVIVFVAVSALVTTQITGTDTGSVLLKSLLGLIVAAGVLFSAFKLLTSSGD